MDAETKLRVRARAEDRCEYCRIHQRHYIITFHVEHIIAKQHHGSDDDSNLALACHFCNRHKGPNIAGLDPETGAMTRLFNPRTDMTGTITSITKLDASSVSQGWVGQQSTYSR